MMSDSGHNGQSIGDYSILDERKATRTEAPQRRSAAFWATLIVLAVALAIVVGYYYPTVVGYYYSTFGKHNIQLAHLPGVLDSFTGVNKRLADAEAKLGAWSINQDALGARLSKLESKLETRLTANLRDTRKQTQGMIVKFQQEMQKELNQRTQGTDARLSQLESAHEAEHMQLAKLEEQMAGVQQQVAGARQEIDGVRRDTSSDVASLRQQEAQSQTRLEAVTNKLARERVDFEVAKNETRELAPGISLYILRTDVRYQRYAGYVDFAPDSRTVWIENQGAQQPMVFRRKEGGEPYELVVTGVQRRGVAGYMLLPTTVAADAPTSARSAVSTTAGAF